LISDLSLYDIQHTKGVGADLSHIETRAKVKAYVGKDELGDALKGIDVVVIPAGVPQKPGKINCYFFYQKNKKICCLRYDTR